MTVHIVGARLQGKQSVVEKKNGRKSYFKKKK
jgi:hypothetical protein